VGSIGSSIDRSIVDGSYWSRSRVYVAMHWQPGTRVLLLVLGAPFPAPEKNMFFSIMRG
jgi:hypothetical protein